MIIQEGFGEYLTSQELLFRRLNNLLTFIRACFLTFPFIFLLIKCFLLRINNISSVFYTFLQNIKRHSR